MVIHTWGWIENAQIVELIDYAEETYGDRVCFLNFRDALERLNQNLLRDVPLRGPSDEDNGVWLLDLNHDGYLDVVSGGRDESFTRLWEPDTQTWREFSLPIRLVESDSDEGNRDAGVHFGRPSQNGQVVMITRSESQQGAWSFDPQKGWRTSPAYLHGFEIKGQLRATQISGRDQGVRFRDVTGDGRDELLISNPDANQILQWQEKTRRWQPLDFALPEQVFIVDEQGRDAGL